jgi:hypothetical protein
MTLEIPSGSVWSRRACIIEALKAKTLNSAFIPSRFTGWFLITMAVCLWPFYFLQCYSDLSVARHAPLQAWLPVLKEIAADILKLAIFLWFGFNFKDYTQRRSSPKSRRRDILQMGNARYQGR